MSPSTGQRCFRYHKGTDFQANHNTCVRANACVCVVLDTTKVLIFKQITTDSDATVTAKKLF